MSSIPNYYQQEIGRLVNSFLNRVEQLKMRLIFGIQIIRGANGKELEFNVADGKLYYDGIDITSGTGGLWQYDSGNDHTELITNKDISLNGYDVKSVAELTGTSTGNLVVTIDNEYALVIQKTSL